MKTLCQILIVLGGLFFFQADTAVAQKVPVPPKIPQELLDAAKKQFELAYKTANGKAPSAKETTKAMAVYTSAIGRLANDLGTRAGEEAKRMSNMRLGFDALDGPALIDVLTNVRFQSLSDFGFSKSKVVALAKPGMAINQLDGRLLVKDPTLVLKLEDNTEIFFPEGVYTIAEQKMSRILETAGKKFPVGIALVGAGKDKTTLKITDCGFARHDVSHLGFRDTTLDCENDGLFDKRQGSLTLRLSNVRLVRFDAGHGGCRSFSINDGLIVHATDSEFVGGFGRSPSNGDVFDRCDIFLGYFKRCRFSGIDYDLFRSIDRNSCLWMDGCRFDREYRENDNVELKDCKFDMKPPAIEWAPQNDTDLSDLKTEV